MNSNTTLIDSEDEKIAKKILNIFKDLILLFLPTSLLAFLGIKSSILLNLLITFSPTILYGFYMLIKIISRFFLIKKNIDLTFSKYSELKGKGWYFLDFTKFLKNYNEGNPDKYNNLILKESEFVSKLKIKYSLFGNNLEIETENTSYSQNSSTSKVIFSYLEFDSKNRKNFTIFYAFSNRANNFADWESKQINNLKNFEGYAKITVYNLKINNFYYVSDFVNRWSFGSYDTNKPVNQKKKGKIHD